VALSASDTGHLIRRTGFGVTGGLFHRLQGLGSRAAAVDHLLDASLSEDDTLAPAGVLPIDRPHQLELAQTWWLDRMVATRAPLVEKMTLFWHGHFTSATDKVINTDLLVNQNRLFRKHALGSFADLAQKVSVDPAMLIYLDNASNVGHQPQENFGRELMEAFTLGPSQRTEADVVAMTSAWTGYGIDRLGERAQQTLATFQYHPRLHDGRAYSLFGLPPRRWEGPDALNELLFGVKAEAMSRFISAKLFSFLAYPITLDDPIAHRLGEVFRKSRLHIRALVRAILLSEEFWSPTARYALVRSPIEWTVAALQGAGLQAATARPHPFLPQMGQVLFHPPTVFGWGQNGYWLATAQTWGKAALARHLAARSGALNDVRGDPPSVVVTRAFQQFGVVNPSAHTREVMEAWVERARSEGSTTLPRDLVVLTLLTPDFQLA
jgi:uncharacterized protein (DUF1800 family)